MRKFGLIGGVGPESTIVYYRLIIKRFQEVTKSNTYPDFLIKNIDMTEMVQYINHKDYDKLTEFLENNIQDIQKAGVDFGAIASNTPHVVYDKLMDRVDLKMISIVEEACKKAKKMKLKTIGLLGTKSTMVNDFYQKTANKYGLKIVVPNLDEIDYIQKIYMEELIYKDIRKDTKQRLIKIVARLQEAEFIEGLVIGGTELSLILSSNDFEEIPVLDTAIIHVDAIVEEMIKN